MALVSEAGVLSSITADSPRTHAEQIVASIRSLLDQTGLARNDLTGVAVSLGPGSYTGLRIGISTAKGYAMSLNIPIIGVSTFSVLASEVRSIDDSNLNASAADDEVVAVLLPARKKDWYIGRIDRPSYNLEPSVKAVKSIDAISSDLGNIHAPVSIITTNKELLLSQAPQFEELQLIHEVSPTAVHVGLIGHKFLTDGIFGDVHDIEPDYLQDSNAIKGKSIFENGPCCVLCHYFIFFWSCYVENRRK